MCVGGRATHLPTQVALDVHLPPHGFAGGGSSIARRQHNYHGGACACVSAGVCGVCAKETDGVGRNGLVWIREGERLGEKREG